MNDRQVDELMALQAIYPDTVSWTLLDGAVEVKVALPVEFEDDKEVEVEDWVSPPPVVAAVAVPAVEALTAGVETVRIGAEKEKPPGEGKNRRRRGRGGGKSVQGAAPPPAGAPRLAAEAQAFQPRNGTGTAGQNVRRGGGRPPPPAAASPPSSAASLPKPPPPALAASSSSSDPPRIRFHPRPASPPPPPTAPPAAPPSSAEQARTTRLSLRYLPSLALRVVLPEGYPEMEGPREVELREECGWLGEERRKRAEETLKQVYTGDECLFPLVDLVSSSSPDFLSTLSLSFPLRLMQPTPSLPSFSSTPPPRLSSLLSTFNRTSSLDAFSSSSHLCPLCFSTVRGSACLRLSSCGCTFCAPCLRDYFSLLITEGLVRSVACPATGCVEERAKWEKKLGGEAMEKDGQKPGRVGEEEVEVLCGAEARKRFEWLKEKVRVESDPTIAFCPLPACQAPVPRLADEEKLRVCPRCSYSFCQFCRRAWHGSRNACALPQSSAIVQAYLDGTDEERKALEARYGVANLRRLVAAHEEEKALQEYLEKNTTQCPGCSVPIQKSHGCNHMSCGKCQTHFCYRCGVKISPSDPYKHFNTPSSSCYERLFDFMPGGEPRVEEWIGEILAEEGL
ncbi:hypothetical protein JCM8097_003564 [Rhodosporidiobolus ruineniae]